MKNEKKFYTAEEVHEMFMRKPGYKEIYEELELEYALRREIIRARIEKDITQKMLAEKMGTKQSAIARFESGNGNPTLDFIQRLTTALGLKLKLTVR